MIGEDGKEMPEERARLIRKVSALLEELTDFERGLLFCWYCKYCHRYVGPGDYCTCTRDD